MKAAALLPQPGGFEGLIAVEENPDAVNPVLGEVVDVPGGVLDGDTTGSPGTGHAHEAQNSIWADCLQTLDDDLEVGACVGDVGEEAPNPAGAVIRSTYVSHWGHKLDIFGAAGKVPVDIPVIDGINGPRDDLHVLLRHRSRSIAALGRWQIRLGGK